MTDISSDRCNHFNLLFFLYIHIQRVSRIRWWFWVFHMCKAQQDPSYIYSNLNCTLIQIFCFFFLFWNLYTVSLLGHLVFEWSNGKFVLKYTFHPDFFDLYFSGNESSPTQINSCFINFFLSTKVPFSITVCFVHATLVLTLAQNEYFRIHGKAKFKKMSLKIIASRNCIDKLTSEKKMIFQNTLLAHRKIQMLLCQPSCVMSTYQVGFFFYDFRKLQLNQLTTWREPLNAWLRGSISESILEGSGKLCILK